MESTEDKQRAINMTNTENLANKGQEERVAVRTDPAPSKSNAISTNQGPLPSNGASPHTPSENSTARERVCNADIGNTQLEESITVTTLQQGIPHTTSPNNEANSTNIFSIVGKDGKVTFLFHLTAGTTNHEIEDATTGEPLRRPLPPLRQPQGSQITSNQAPQ